MAKVNKFWFIASILYVVFIINVICGGINTQRDVRSPPDRVTYVFGIQNGIIICLLSDKLTMVITRKLEIKNRDFIVYYLISFSILLTLGLLFANWILANIIQLLCLQLIAIQVVVIVFAFDVNEWKAFIDKYQA